MGERARRDAGFTIVELLIVIAILGVLSSIVMFSVRGASNNGQAAACATELGELEAAQETAYADGGGYLDEKGLVERQYLRTAPTHHQFVPELTRERFSIEPDDVCTTTTSTTAAPPTTTTTTVPPTTTTSTTAAPIDNGVTVAPSADSSSLWYGTSRLRLRNTGSLTALSITITQKRTAGLSYATQWTSFWSGITHDAHSQSGSAITYTFTLKAGQSMVPGEWGIVGQYNGQGTPHPTSGDTWTVTSTSGGKTSTLSGNF